MTDKSRNAILSVTQLTGAWDVRIDEPGSEFKRYTGAHFTRPGKVPWSLYLPDGHDITYDDLLRLFASRGAKH